MLIGRAPVSVDVRRHGKDREVRLAIVDALIVVIIVAFAMHGLRAEVASWKNVFLFLAIGVTCVPAGVGYLWLWGVKDPLRFLELGEYTPGRGLIYIGYAFLILAVIGSLLAAIETGIRAYRRWHGDGA